MSIITKPFRSGKCQVCHSEEYLKAQKLCASCESYVSQNTKTLQDQPLLIDVETIPLTKEENWLPILLNGQTPSLDKMLEGADLTRQQMKIMKLTFAENQTIEQINLKLGISRASVQVQLSRAIEKVKIRHTNSHIVRGKDVEDEELSTVSEIKKSPSTSRKPKSKVIDPYHYYSKCPRCNHTDLIGRGNRGSCANCGWTFAVYSVEEVQNSHTWPSNPILDGSDY